MGLGSNMMALVDLSRQLSNLRYEVQRLLGVNHDRFALVDCHGQKIRDYEKTEDPC